MHKFIFKNSRRRLTSVWCKMPESPHVASLVHLFLFPLCYGLKVCFVVVIKTQKELWCCKEMTKSPNSKWHFNMHTYQVVQHRSVLSAGCYFAVRRWLSVAHITHLAVGALTPASQHYPESWKCYSWAWCSMQGRSSNSRSHCEYIWQRSHAYFFTGI